MPDRPPDENEPPPFPGGWRALYMLVMAGLALAILLLGLITRGCA